MGKWKERSEKVKQKSICFKQRQYDFMDEHHEFNPHKFCQFAIDEQIKLHPDGEKYLDVKKTN